MSEIRNEQIKLSAMFLNGLGIATFAVGGIAPLFSSFYRSGDMPVYLPAVSGVCLVLALALHFAGMHLLKRLTP